MSHANLGGEIRSVMGKRGFGGGIASRCGAVGRPPRLSETFLPDYLSSISLCRSHGARRLRWRERRPSLANAPEARTGRSIGPSIRNRACICTASGRPECTPRRTFAIASRGHCHCRVNACFEEAPPGFPYLALASLGGRAGLPGDQGSVRGGPPPRGQGPDLASRRGLSRRIAPLRRVLRVRKLRVVATCGGPRPCYGKRDKPEDIPPRGISFDRPMGGVAAPHSDTQYLADEAGAPWLP
jgi:hypothetical protein